MLLQLEHEHKNRQQVPSSPKIEQIANSRVTKKPEIHEQPQSIFFNPQFYPETSSFDFHIDGLQELHKLSLEELPPFVITKIAERKKFSEERVYQAIVQTSVDFVGIHLREFKQGMKSEMSSMFETIHNAVEAGIWDGRYEINQSRNKYFSMAKKEKELIGFITAELVKRNLDSFRQELDEEEQASETLDLSQHHAKSENYKTRKAEDFVKRMKDEQIRHQSELSRQLEERKIKEFKTLEERMTEDQQRRKEKQEMVRQRLERQSQIIGVEKERRQKIHSEYLKMVSSYRKPLYKEREDRYNKSVVEEQKKNYKILRELKEEKRPINFDQIQQHMARYEELRQENESFRQQKRELKESENEIIASKRPYRSKFYSLVAREQPKTDDMQQKTALLKKQVDYAQHVKHNFAPRADEKKQQELQQLIKRINVHKNHTYHSRKYMDEGKRNLEKLHLLIGELRAKNKLKENPSIDQVMESRQPPKKYKNYLEEIKQAKLKDTNGVDIVDFEDKIKGKDAEQIHLISKQREDKAKQREHYLSNSIESIDIHTHMMGNSMVEQNYIEAAKAKMALLKKYKPDDDSPSPSLPPLPLTQ